jgi:hypothetical protein
METDNKNDNKKKEEKDEDPVLTKSEVKKVNEILKVILEKNIDTHDSDEGL